MGIGPWLREGAGASTNGWNTVRVFWFTAIVTAVVVTPLVFLLHAILN